jgi:alpha-L-rhamnosidase
MQQPPRTVQEPPGLDADSMHMLKRPRQLRTEYQVDPLGLDETEPRFAWLIDDDRPGARQAAYQILVASRLDLLDADSGDLWDSGQVRSDSTVHVVYGGAPLGSFAASVWKVRTWDADGASSPWSDPARFELGPLTTADWAGATFIRSALVGNFQTSAPAPYLRRAFRLEGNVQRARLYITALGLYEVSINGQLATADVYRPGWTEYSRRVPYQAYDVSTLLDRGENVIGVILGDGWYCGFVGERRQIWGDRPQLLAKLVVSVEGSQMPVVIGTDGEWHWTAGPILSNDNYNGETYDARLELAGWDKPGYEHLTRWEPAEIVPAFTTRAEVVATIAPPVRRKLEMRPQTVTARPNGAFQFDFGQNMVGRARLRVTAPSGTELTLRFAEMLKPDGSLYTENLLTAKATDRYVCKGGGEEVWEPRFTFHGFRYAEVSGSPVPLDQDALTGVVIHSDCAEVGDFECSNELINRLQNNIRWSQRGNFIDVPTDCPQRAERLGWTGDIQVFATTSTFNMDVSSFLAKYVADLRDGQLIGGVDRGSFPMVAPRINAQPGGPGWADAGVIVPWVLYERYADVRVLERHYPAMLAYIDFLDRAHHERSLGTWLGFGDWLSLDATTQEIEGFGSADTFGGTQREFIWLAFDAHSTDIVRKTAALLGFPEDAARLGERRDHMVGEFVRRYVDADGHLTLKTQTAYVLALQFDLLPEASARQAAADDLVANLKRNGHLQTGFVGTPYLLHVLSDIGRTDLAYLLLERVEYPGWLYPVTQGATTVWERWDAWTHTDGFKAHYMNSFNHYAYGSVGEWLFRVVAGIDTTLDGTGYRRALIRPELGGSLISASGYVDTLHGRISSAWHLEHDHAVLRISLPANTLATLRLPARSIGSVAHGDVGLEDVTGISDVTLNRGRVQCVAEAGTYEFVVASPTISRISTSEAQEPRKPGPKSARAGLESAT